MPSVLSLSSTANGSLVSSSKSTCFAKFCGRKVRVGLSLIALAAAVLLTVAPAVALPYPGTLPTAHFVATQTVSAVATSTAGTPLVAVRDAAGNTYDLLSTGAVYKLAPGCFDYVACGGTAIVPATAGNVDVAVDTTGALYVLNSTASTITKYVAALGVYSGTVLYTTTSSPFSLDVDGSGTIYVGLDRTIVSYATGATSPVTLASLSGAVNYLRLDHQGNLVGATNNSSGGPSLYSVALPPPRTLSRSQSSTWEAL